MQQTRHNRKRNKLRIIAKLCARKGGDAIDEKFRCRLQVADEEVRDGFVGFESVAAVPVSAFFDDFGGLIQCGVCTMKRDGRRMCGNVPWLSHIKNLRPAAGQPVRELAGGQTALANYLGAIPS